MGVASPRADLMRDVLRLEPPDYEALLAMSHRRTLVRNEFVFEAGEPSQEVYILLRGQIKVFKVLASGKEVILWFCRPGEPFGLAEVAAGGRRRVHAKACEESELLVTSEAALRRFMQNHPGAAWQFFDLLSGRMRHLVDLLAGIVDENVSQRVGKLLGRLCAQHGRTVPDGVCLDLVLTHQEIADMVGTSRQTVTTALCEMKRRKMLSTRRRHIVIHDRALLEDAQHGG